MYTVGFVILTWNSEKFIRECLTAICSLKQDTFSINVIVIDNGSTDKTKEIISNFFACHNDNLSFKSKLIELNRDYGTTYSRNIGLGALLSDENVPNFICVLDSDTEINSKALEIMCEYAKRNDDYGIIGPKMHNRENIYQVSGRNIPTLTEKLYKVLPLKRLQEKGEEMQTAILEDGTGCVEVGYLMSACWLMRTETVRKIGYLDEKIFYSPEDVDYCIRCWKAGYKVVYCYDAEIVHLWQRISRQKLFSRHNFEQLKGLGYLFRKYHYAFSTKKLWKSIDQAFNKQVKLQWSE